VWRFGNKVAMNNNLRKISPFGLGIALFCYQLVQQPMVRAASLGSNNESDLTSLAPSIPVEAPTAAASGGCPLSPLNAPQKSGALPSQGSAASSGLGYQSETIAQADGVKVAQLVPDENCCELGGTVDCELGGIAPAGGAAAAAGFPFAALAGLLPLAAVPFAFGGGDNNDSSPAVPEPSSTAGIVAGFGMLGLWFSRRFRRAGRNLSP
jgi:PEP-CTERM motif